MTGRIITGLVQKMYGYKTFINNYLYNIARMVEKSDIKIINDINALNIKNGFMNKYGSDVWGAIVLCVIFLYLIFDVYAKNYLEVIRADWPNKKCNALVMPFAGHIIKNIPGQTPLEFTVSNFSSCINGILSESSTILMEPFRVAFMILNEAVANLIATMQKFREVVEKFRSSFNDTINQIYAKISDTILTSIEFTATIKDTISKISGTMTTITYAVIGGYMSLESMFKIIVENTVLILVVMAGMATTLYIIAYVLGPWGIIPKFLGFGIVLTGISIGIPLTMMNVTLTRVMELSPPTLPGIPGCFGKDTKIELLDKTIKRIKDINIGDILQDGSIVTCTIKFNATQQELFILFDIVVTGYHRVLFDNEWIYVKNHPASILIKNNEKYVYCLNTTSKKIIINNTTFSDWDDIDENVLDTLNKNCVRNGILPHNFTIKDIHPYMDGGVHENTGLCLSSGDTIRISDVKVGHKLKSGDIVIGCIKISGENMKLYSHSIGNDIIIGTRNLQLLRNNNNNNNKVVASEISTESSSLLYHILTDTKQCMFNNIKCGDYNTSIDNFLY